MATDDQTPDEDPSWDLVRPAGGTAYNRRRRDAIDQPVIRPRDTDPVLSADPDGSSWLLRPDDGRITRSEDRGTALLYGIVTFIATTVIGLIVTVAVTGPTEATPITTPVVSFAPRPSLTAVPSTVPSADTGDEPLASDDTAFDDATTTTTPTESSIGAPIVVATEEGVLRETSAGTTRVIDGSFDVVIPVGDGSYLAQARSGRGADALDTSLLRISADGVPTRVLEPAEGIDEWFTLHDLIVRNGTFTALVVKATGTLPDDSVEEILLVPLDGSASVSLLTRDAWDSRISHLTVGNGLLVGELIDESATSESANRPLLVRFTEVGDGSVTTDVIDPTPFGLADSYSECFVCPRVFGIDSSGQRIGWIEGDLLVIVDVASLQRLLLVPLPQGTGERVASIEIGSTGVLLNRRLSADGPFQKSLVVTGDGSIGASNYFGRAAFPNDIAN